MNLPKRILLSVAIPTVLVFLGGGCGNITLPGDLTDPNTGGSGTATVARALTGTIVAPESAKRAPRQETDNAGLAYSVVVQSVESGEVYLGQTDANGAFNVSIPEGETGATFIVTLVNPAGQPAGPIVFEQSGGAGKTGLHLVGAADLGAIAFPDDHTQQPIVPGGDANLGDATVDTDVTARLDDNGVPVGVATFGRESDSQGAASTDPKKKADCDQDGMIDLFDADDDGDGTIDNFDDDADLDAGVPDGLDIHFFMNLKIDDVQATPYFSGDTTGIETSLKQDTVITFEVRGDPAVLGKNITAAKIIAPPAPAPSYLSSTTVAFAGGALWSTSSYALRPDGTNHFQEWVVPNDFMNTGDTFTVELTYDDGTTGVYSRMVNYVFKSIPKLINVGPPSTLVPYNGPGKITFDGTKDLVLEWAPPVDDFGHLMVGLDYKFELFYYDSSGAQINDIDGVATWPTPITNWQTNGPIYEVAGSTLTTLSPSNTFSVQLPKEIFVDTVQTTSSGGVAVSRYKIDIAAQNSGNNAALMVELEKH